MKGFEKFVVALTGAAASALALGLVPDPQSKYVTVAVGFLTALGVRQIPNAQ